MWKKGITELAACPNVYVKLGGLGMPYLGMGLDKLPVPASSKTLAQAWGSFYGHCPVIWNTFKRIAAQYSASEKHELFFGTANRVYRLGVGLK